jgi:hypothetical protein
VQRKIYSFQFFIDFVMGVAIVFARDVAINHKGLSHYRFQEAQCLLNLGLQGWLQRGFVRRA